MNTQDNLRAENSDKNYQYTFTVFTAAYNRAHTLNRVYEGLKLQTYNNFEWLVVDDGSSDNTRELLQQWQRENAFLIRYIYQENQGKHIAFNVGVTQAKGELFLNLDSDDECLPNALERFKYYWDTIPLEEKHKFSAVTCLCKDQHGNLVGNRFPYDITDSDSLEIKYKYKVYGDKWGFHSTNVLKKYPFPQSVKNVYVPEIVVWNSIAKKFKTRFVNEILRVYWIEGSSLSRGGKINRDSLGIRLAQSSILNNDIYWLKFAPKSFFISAMHYSRHSAHLGISISEQFKDLKNTASKFIWILALPFGYTLYLTDRAGLTKSLKFLLKKEY
ncbi:MAG: glycosyltransferase family 2 protein [Cyanobacteria bacterium P01_A01_bin.45]